MDLSQRPGDHECFDYHRDYVGKVPDGNILDRLKDQSQTVPVFIANLPEDQLEVVHAPYGWKIRTVVEHCCDAERVFGYRVLRFSTGDKTELSGWDENHYAACGYGNANGTQQLADEFASLRNSNIALINRLRSSAFDEMGVADGRKVSVRTIIWLMAGHWLHHESILKKRLSG